MGISRYPSIVSLPQVNPGVTTVLDYLVVRFPSIAREVWQQRMAAGKVHWHDGSLVSAASPYRPQQRVYYYREVESETVLPFAEQILFQDQELLVVDKPPFMPVTPGGRTVNQCLQNRLRERLGLDDLQAIHRLDRATSGLVLFSVNPATRPLYHQLFATRQVDKTYHAVARVEGNPPLVGQQWEVCNRIVRSEPRFLRRVVDGQPNSRSLIRCLALAGGRALFELTPITGKTHQLRLHMQSLGWPLLYDHNYPTLQPEAPDDYDRPLQLLAKRLGFTDPVTQRPRAFTSPLGLSLSPPASPPATLLEPR